MEEDDRGGTHALLFMVETYSTSPRYGLTSADTKVPSDR